MNNHIFRTNQLPIFFLLLTFIFFTVSCDKNNNLPENKKRKIKYNELSNIDIKSFYGRPLSYLLDTIETPPLLIEADDEMSRYLSGCTVKYPDKTILYVIYDTVIYQTAYSEERIWVDSLLSKELVYRIGIHIKGMPVKMQYWGPLPLPIEERKRRREIYKNQ